MIFFLKERNIFFIDVISGEVIKIKKIIIMIVLFLYWGGILNIDGLME